MLKLDLLFCSCYIVFLEIISHVNIILCISVIMLTCQVGLFCSWHVVFLEIISHVYIIAYTQASYPLYRSNNIQQHKYSSFDHYHWYCYNIIIENFHITDVILLLSILHCWLRVKSCINAISAMFKCFWGVISKEWRNNSVTIEYCYFLGKVRFCYILSFAILNLFLCM